MLGKEVTRSYTRNEKVNYIAGKKKLRESRTMVKGKERIKVA